MARADWRWGRRRFVFADTATPDVFIPDQTVALGLDGSAQLHSWHVDRSTDRRVKVYVGPLSGQVVERFM